MTSYKLLLDPAKFLGAHDFPKPREVTIARMSREDLPQRKGEAKAAAPMLYVQTKDGREYERPLKVPKSLLYGLSLMFGTEYEGWVGKKITMYAAHCLAFGDVEPCVRFQFPPAIDAQVRKWLKKRKAPAAAYMTDAPRTESESVPAAEMTQEQRDADERADLIARGEL